MAVHQFVPTLNPHDATGTHTLRLREALRRAGWRSEIFAEAIHDDLAGAGLQALDVPGARRQPATWPSTSSRRRPRWPATCWSTGCRSSSTSTTSRAPSSSPAGSTGSVERAARAGGGAGPARARWRCSGWPTARSARRQLRRAGCRRTVVVPVLTDYGRPTAEPDRRVAAELWPGAAEGGADLLFVGRVVPSKAQHDLVKALWAYRRLYDPRARLHLVGGTSSYAYSKALLELRAGPRARRRGPHGRRGFRRLAWPPTSAPPTCTCRSPRTRASGCPW